MAYQEYKSEDELVELLQSGEIGWVDYVNHHSPEWQQEYTVYCQENNLIIGEASAEKFVEYKGNLLEENISE